MRAPKLAGAWAVRGYQNGKGKVYGTLTIDATSAEDEFATKLDLHYANSDVTLARTGKSIVYTGYSWRGRQTLASKPAEAPIPETTRWNGKRP